MLLLGKIFQGFCFWTIFDEIYWQDFGKIFWQIFLDIFQDIFGETSAEFVSGELAVLHGIACSLRADEGGMLGRV